MFICFPSGTEVWRSPLFELMWMICLMMSSCPTVFWHELDGKMGHVGENINDRDSEKPLWHIHLFPRAVFPMAHNRLPVDLIGSAEQAPDWRHAGSHNLQQISSSPQRVLYIFYWAFKAVCLLVEVNTEPEWCNLRFHIQLLYCVFYDGIETL